MISIWGGPRRRRMFGMLAAVGVVALFAFSMGLRPWLPLVAIGAAGMALFIDGQRRHLDHDHPLEGAPALPRPRDRHQPDAGHVHPAELADPVISKLPEGYDQMLGRTFAKGHDLSGGEWQKLAIARAYMRDAGNHHPRRAHPRRSTPAPKPRCSPRFKNLAEGTTAVLISHRFSTVRMADRIVVLADGKVEEQGTHAELMVEWRALRGTVRAAGGWVQDGPLFFNPSPPLLGRVR